MSKILLLDYYVFYLVLFSLPFGMNVFIPILFAWLCLVAISYFVKRDYSTNRFRGLLLLPALFYLFHLLGVALSSDIEGGLFDFQIKLSLLLLPLLYPFHREIYKKSRASFFWSFVFGCAAASLYFIGYAVYQTSTFVNGVWVFNPTPEKGMNSHFFGSTFSYLIHPSYLSLYFLVAFLIIGVELNRWWRKGFAIRTVVILTATLLMTSLFMLQSRAGILGFGLLAFVWLIYLVLAKRRYLLGLGVLVALLVLSFFVVTRLDRISKTAKSLEKTAQVGIKNQNKEDGTTVRLWIWKSAFSVIHDHPVWGIGTGDIRDEMHKQYESRGMAISAQYRHNAHNQYLETWLGVGIFGLLALLAMLFVPLWIGIKKRDWLLVGFICLCSTSFMFESMLNSVVGVGFFAIFYTVLVSRKAETNVPMS
ncbi:O-antigen ligase family protein [Williamwhitmania taraxaci]|uniref:O-Antigen ligase n=1 Tax=Williamwhitmania taraxaci TaxID=1640674 RepID=A0A1G6GM10_9BACT|nr:O-antigen ligase family protein [Williamwhitmania taraxaci]SDB82964.1 O-Antigen ligase [Williamwhitmania taraxaci]